MKTASKAGKEAEAVFKGFREFGGVKNNWLVWKNKVIMHTKTGNHFVFKFTA